MTHSQSFDAVTTALFVVQWAQRFASDMESNEWKLYRRKKYVVWTVLKCARTHAHTHTHTYIHQVVMCGEAARYGMKKDEQSTLEEEMEWE